MKVNSWPGLSRYKKEKLVPAYNWHVTLAFLGNIPKEKLDSLQAMLKKEDWEKVFDVGISQFGGFPSLDKARVLFSGLKRGEERVRLLAEHIRQKLDELGISYDEKPFVPHITLARLKFPKNASGLSENGKMKQEIVFSVDHFVLYESKGGQQPYEMLQRIELKHAS